MWRNLGLEFFLSFGLVWPPCSRVWRSAGECVDVMCRKFSVDGFSRSTAGLSQSIDDTFNAQQTTEDSKWIWIVAKLQEPILRAEADIAAISSPAGMFLHNKLFWVGFFFFFEQQEEGNDKEHEEFSSWLTEMKRLDVFMSVWSNIVIISPCCSFQALATHRAFLLTARIPAKVGEISTWVFLPH